MFTNSHHNLALELLLHHYLEWQKKLGQVKTKKEFAAYCGLNESYFNTIMKGKRPVNQKLAVKLAKRLNDPRFYDVLDIPHPDSDLQLIIKNWPYLNDDARRNLAIQAKSFAEGR